MPHTIHNYSSLQVDIRLWCARNDTDFVAALPEFIHMAEQRITYGSEAPRPSEPIRVRDMQTTVPLDVITGVTATPDAYLEQTSMAWDSDTRKTITYKPPEEFHTICVDGDFPVIFTVEDDTILFKPAVTGTANFVYYARYAELENDTDTNWLLLNAPSIYLKGSLIEAFGFMRNGQEQNNAYADYVSAANGLTKQTRQALQAARLFPTIPDADFNTSAVRG